MQRFEIEDIVTQDKNGITFRARDTQTGRTVALRRFMPFGSNGGGLEADETKAFASAAERLSSVTHKALRAVVMGGADPIDGVPYIAVEWVEGASLKSVMGDTTLDPGLVIDVLRIALEVSALVSHVLGEEAVWVETTVDSIYIGAEGSEREFVFWISPYKWLGAEFESRKLSSIVELGEELTGWKGKLVANKAGHGLGGYLKWLKNNPDARIHEALETLASSTGNEISPPAPAIVAKAKIGPAVDVKSTSSSGPIMIAAAAVLLLAVSTLIFLNTRGRNAPAPSQTASLAQLPIVETKAPITEPKNDGPVGETTEPPDESPEEPGSPLAPEEPATGGSEIDRVNALAKKLADEAAASAPKGPPPAPPAPPARVAMTTLTPDDAELISTLEDGTPVRLQGVVRATNDSTNKTFVYLDFSDPLDKKQIRAVIFPPVKGGRIAKEAFASMIGKSITMEGKVIRKPWNPIPMVQINVTTKPKP